MKLSIWETPSFSVGLSYTQETCNMQKPLGKRLYKVWHNRGLKNFK
jgi:hypothetical protein